MDFLWKTSIVFTVLFLSSTNKFVEGQSSTINLAKSLNTFGLDFYQQIIKNENGNVFCSGYSLSTVLSMLLAGAKGNTATQIQNTLGYQGLSEQQVETAYHALLTQQQSNSKGYQLDVANSVWIKQGFQVLQSYNDIVENVYDAEEQEVAFGTQAATDQINSWVNSKTNGKIPTLFDSTLPVSTLLVLVNAMYFKGTWQTKFAEQDTASEPFYLGSSNNQQRIQMMNIYTTFLYVESNDLNAQLLELPYDGNDVSMIVVLPTTVAGLSTLETQITESNLEAAINQMYSTKVHVKFPKFTTTSSYDLISMLQSLGINDAFGSQADFSGIDGQRDLYVSQGIQKAVVEVNENGTVAAAATGFGMKAMALVENEPPEIYFTADHPFLYFIRHNPTGVMLFMGRTASP